MSGDYKSEKKKKGVIVGGDHWDYLLVNVNFYNMIIRIGRILDFDRIALVTTIVSFLVKINYIV